MAIHAVEKKQLSATGMLHKVRSVFQQIPEPLRSSKGVKARISLSDCLMSGLAVFGLKFGLVQSWVTNLQRGAA